jgi:hypothetical protein
LGIGKLDALVLVGEAYDLFSPRIPRRGLVGDSTNSSLLNPGTIECGAGTTTKNGQDPIPRRCWRQKQSLWLSGDPVASVLVGEPSNLFSPMIHWWAV